MPCGSGSSSKEFMAPGGRVTALVGEPDATGILDAGAFDAPRPPGAARLSSLFVGSGRGAFRMTGGGADEFVPRGPSMGLTRIPPGATAFVPPARVRCIGRLRISSRFVRMASRVAASGRALGGGADWSVPTGAFAGLAAVPGAAAFVPPARARDRASLSACSLFVPRPPGEAPDGSGAKEGVWAHKLKPVRSKVSSVFFTVI